MPPVRPVPTPVPGPGPARRTLLRLAGLAAATTGLAACGVRWDDVRLDDVPTPQPPTLSPDDLVRFGAVVEVQALLDLATLWSDSGGAAVADRHRAHLAQLGPLPGPVPSPSATPSGWPTTSPAPTAPSDAAALGAAELAASGRLLASVEGAADLGGGLARLVVAVATSCRAVAADLAVPGRAPVGLPAADAVDPAGLRAGGDALTDLVEAHRAAAHGGGVLAVRLAGAPREAARAQLAAHSAAAAALVDLAEAAGVQVGPAQPAYVVGRPADAAAAAALALGLELDVAGAAGALVAATTGDWRTVAADQVVAAGLTARTWGALPDFPGLPGLS